MSRHRSDRTAVPALSLLLLAGGATAWAQPLLFRIAAPTAVTDGVDELGTRSVSPPAHDDALIDGLQTADGQCAVAATGAGVRVRHLASGAITQHPIDFRPAVADPRRLRSSLCPGGECVRLDALTGHEPGRVVLSGARFDVVSGTLLAARPAPAPAPIVPLPSSSIFHRVVATPADRHLMRRRSPSAW